MPEPACIAVHGATMTESQVYQLVSIVSVALIIMLLFVWRRDKETNKLSQLAYLAFGFILAGLYFSGNPVLGYGFMIIGVIVAIIDALRKENQG
jgi:uncharacterized membrane protein